MAESLIDSDVFIDHLRGARDLPVGTHAYSVITRSELFAGWRQSEDNVRGVLEAHRELIVDRVVAERAGRLRRVKRSLRTPDALVAATAIAYGLPLLTRNVRDFEDLPGLRVLSP